MGSVVGPIMPSVLFCADEVGRHFLCCGMAILFVAKFVQRGETNVFRLEMMHVGHFGICSCFTGNV